MATLKAQATRKVHARQPVRSSNESGAGLEDFIYTVVQRYVNDLQAGKDADGHAR